MCLLLLSLRCEEGEFELADLDLVASGQLGLVDLLAVDVGAVEAARVLDEPFGPPPLERCVLARHRDVVEEDHARRVSTDRRAFLFHEEGGPGVRTTFDEHQRLTGGELIVRERELLVRLVVGLDRRKRQGHVLLKGMTTIHAEAGVISIRMSTAATEQRRHPPGPPLRYGSMVGTNPRSSTSAGRYPTRPRASTRPWDNRRAGTTRYLKCHSMLDAGLRVQS